MNAENIRMLNFFVRSLPSLKTNVKERIYFLHSLSAWWLLTLFLLLGTVTSCQQSKDGKPDGVGNLRFTEVFPEESGIDFNNTIAESEALNYFTWEYLYNGGGVGIADLNNDLLPDLVFTGNQIPDQIYLSKGKLQYEKTDLLPQDTFLGWSSGISFIDINGDGWIDIYISKGGPYHRGSERANQLYINQNGKGFIEKAAQYGIADTGYTTQSAFLDYDNDGDLDLYVMNHPPHFTSSYTTHDLYQLSLESEFSDQLYENIGSTYTQVTEKAGIQNHGFGLGLTVGDLNNDGYADIYVSNDFDEADFLYINQRDGTFKNEILERTKHISHFGMGVDIADINLDGNLDFMTLDMAFRDHVMSKKNMASMSESKFKSLVKAKQHFQYMTNALQLNNGFHTFSEIGQMAGVDKSSWSWSILFGDYDHDGFPDIFITNGFKRNVLDRDYQASVDPKQAQAEGHLLSTLNQAASIPADNIFFRSNGDLTFTPMTSKVGISGPSISQGAAYADLDLDGDLDLVINNQDQIAQLYRNELNDKNWIKIRLQGSSKNQLGIGARVEIHQGKRILVRENHFEKGYLSSSTDILHFGLGQKDITKIVVKWPDGSQTIEEEAQEGFVKISHSDAMIQEQESRSRSYFFIDRTQKFPFKYHHREDPYNDFKQELLLPHKNSQLGPAMAVADFDEDGLEDIYIGGAATHHGYILKQSADGRFEICAEEVMLADAKYEDTGALFFDCDQDGDLDLYVVSGGNNVGETWHVFEDRLYLNLGSGIFRRAENHLPFANISGEAISAADIDSDGDLDLFLGGRLSPGKYPSSPTSRLLINEHGIFKEDQIFNDQFSRLGMVTASQFADLDLDDDYDLIIAGEWMPIIILLNNDGVLNEKIVLPHSNGWWFSLHMDDFDQDGDPEIIAGNLGENHKFKASKLHPFNVYAGDFDRNSSWDIILSQYQQDHNYPIRGRECSSEQMPFIKEQFKSYQQFAVATIDDIIPEASRTDGIHLQVHTFQSSIFWNHGGKRFERIALPKMAQIFPVRTIISRDLNLDGSLDLVLAGNLFETEVETVRHDAGYGLVLLNTPTKEFEPLPAFQSGLYLPGNLRHLVPFVYTHQEIPLVLAGTNNHYMEVLQINQTQPQ